MAGMKFLANYWLSFFGAKFAAINALTTSA
jgi:hypothetical protein